MKLLTQITAIGSLTATAFAGEIAPVQTTMATSAPAPSVGDWFAGVGFGQLEGDAVSGAGLDDFDFDMYTLHVGRNLGTQFLGCDLAAYFEVGFLDGDSSFRGGDVNLEIIPLTFNLMAERHFFAGIKGYLSAGIGYAFTDVEAPGVSDSDGGFYAHASIGLAYDLNETWEIYGGARWVYMEELDVGVDFDAIGYEIGLRYTF